MALFGFPDAFSDYEAKHYLRLLIIVGAYLILRPYLVGVGERIQHRQLNIAQQQLAEHRAQKAKEEQEELEAAEKFVSAESTGSEWGWGNNAKASQSNKSSKPRTKQDDDDMPSDEDVSDLLQ
jgi:hypothetical protein